MGKDSKIEWCDHTFNPVWGCVKCDPGCENCYANSLASRFGYDVWGPEKPRRLFGEKHWNEPRRWDKQAAKQGIKAKVFCGSMCDVFEIHANNEWQRKLDVEREKLWGLINKTPNLIWMLLTKRPENVLGLIPDVMPKNVWMGVSVSEPNGMRRVEELAKIPARVRFLSVEPMIGMVWASRYIDWVIIGGESEQHGKARPLPISSAADLIEQCDHLAIPVFVKQMGTHWAKRTKVDGWKTAYELGDRKGQDMSYWHEMFHRREFPT